MKHLEEKELSREMIYQGRIINLRQDTVRLPNGKEARREVVEHKGAVAIIALTKRKEIVLVKQFRKPAGEIILEIPAGVPGKEEKRENTALRELEEETGFTAKKIKKIWQGYTSPGYSDEMIEYFLAEGLEHIGQNPDEDEFVEPVIVKISTAINWIKNGKIQDNKTVVGIFLAKQLKA